MIGLRPVDAARWDAVVAAHPEATPFHLAGFLTTAGGCLGLDTHLTLAEADGEVLGAVPLLVRGRGPVAQVGHRLPFPYLGPLLPPGTSPDVVLPAVRRYLRPRGLVSWDVQSVRPFPVAGRGWQADPCYDSAVATVPGTDDDLVAAWSGSRRRQLDKALRAGLRAGPATRDEIAEHLPRWTADTFRRQGLPPRWPTGAHVALHDVLVRTGSCLATAVRRDGEVLLVSLDLHLGARVVGWELGMSAEGRSAGATLLLYAELMRRARDLGATELDLLGSPTPGMASFKASLGARPRPRGVARWSSPLLPLAKRLTPTRSQRRDGAALSGAAR